MEYRPEVQEYIDFIEKEYTVNTELKTFHILHMYPGEVAYPNGYYDSRFFDLVLFNTDTMEKRTIECRDGIDASYRKNIPFMMARIFADGSTMLKFYEAMAFDVFQSVTIYEAED